MISFWPLWYVSVELFTRKLINIMKAPRVFVLKDINVWLTCNYTNNWSNLYHQTCTKEWVEWIDQVLQSSLNALKMLVIFIRSADWCSRLVFNLKVDWMHAWNLFSDLRDVKTEKQYMLVWCKLTSGCWISKHSNIPNLFGIVI